ncbi:hypothetical protein C1H46_032560 [Malus baccata]|uniref:Uncharacterized protein n=1 Tax=Malus baccata TaxID=106549 RepID=A0A540L6D5_MALBA|nr:hypothetical protein C1H46_032560 [Malus baccata]
MSVNNSSEVQRKHPYAPIHKLDRIEKLEHDLLCYRKTENSNFTDHMDLSCTKDRDVCFSGGLLGPDGTNRFLGKWCKQGLNKGSESRQNPSADSGNLIAVGADGRGGRIKVLRSLNHSIVDNKENAPGTKRFKSGSKANSVQSQGCLQIEHFFGRVGR